MTGLRTRFGLNIEKWQDHYQLDFYQKYKKVLDKYATMLEIEDGNLKVTSQGMELLDTILVEFLMED